MKTDFPLKVRMAKATDAENLCTLLNEIIAIGGTTAFETELESTEFEAYFISGSRCISCYVAEHKERVCGFQSLTYHPKLDDGWADIATFARVKPRIKGVGTALFKQTIKFAGSNNISFINATIRSDNHSGLSYYSKMGFSDYLVSENVPLKSGKLVDRISKRYPVVV